MDITENVTVDHYGGGTSSTSLHSESAGSYISRATVLSVMALIGILGNILVFVAIGLSRKLQTMTNILIINLSAGDLIICLVLPFQAAGLLSEDGWPLPEATCTVVAAVTLDAAVCSVITIMLIAINRCVLITKSRKTYSRVFSGRNVAAMIAFSWVYPTIVLVIPQLAGHGRLGYDAPLRHCVYDYGHPKGRIFLSLYAASAFVAFVIMFVSYWRIFRHVRNSALALGASSSAGNAQQRQRRNTELTITKNMLFVVFCYVLCVSPASAVYLAIGIVRGRAPYSHNSDVLRIAAHIAGLLIVLNSCINPVIYAWKHPHFKVVIACILRRRWRDIPKPSRWLRWLLSTDGAAQYTVTVETTAGGVESTATPLD